MEQFYKKRWFDPIECQAFRAVEGRMAWERVALPRPVKAEPTAEQARAGA